MKKQNQRTHYKTHLISWAINTVALLFIFTSARADNYALVKGYWQCQEDGVPVTLEFISQQQLLYNGQAYNYQFASGFLQVQEGADLVNYFLTVEGDVLLIMALDGSVTQCQKAQKPPQTAANQKPGQPAIPSPSTPSTSQYWPPPYARPQGQVDESNPGDQALLYKFAGRWDHVTTNTLTNLFLKPDGTYEEAYESGYSGTFQDQGGYQTGNWGTSGAQQGLGRWKVAGGLRNGTLYLVDQNGRENVYHYQVHIQNGEVFWGEYFFNGQLYSVKYIYR